MAKFDYQPDEEVKVVCTDTDRESMGIIISTSHDRITVLLDGGITLSFHKKGKVYVANMSGLEFVVTL
jgi:hypothetical protein